jgi:hypothetical protein
VTRQVVLAFPDGSSDVHYLTEILAVGTAVHARGSDWTVARVEGNTCHLAQVAHDEPAAAS